MDSIRPSPAPNRSKLSETLRKITLKKKPKWFNSNNHNQLERETAEAATMANSRDRAFLAKLFAAVSAIKATYAELQAAQHPYNDAAVHSADQAVVEELKSLSELKRRFMKNQLGSSPPHVTVMLAEIQEQQAMMRMYEITMRKMQGEIEKKEKKLSSLQEQMNEIVRNNLSMEKKMRSSGSFSIFDGGVRFSDLSPKHFALVLQYATRSVRSFVRFLIREMESANWDIEAAADAIQSGVVFTRRDHRAFVFESFFCRGIFDGFNDPNFSIRKTDIHLPGDDYQRRVFFFEQFRKLSSADAIQFLKQNPNSQFGWFLKSKYLQLVHPKMELSFWGNLNQRKTVSSGEFPETEFFKVFAEMSRRVWLLHCLALSLDHAVGIFQAKRNAKFSEVYMESVADGGDGELRVAFTVVPGFKLRRTVVQSQVYLFPAKIISG